MPAGVRENVSRTSSASRASSTFPVPNEFTKNWIEGHFSSLLDAAAAEHELVVELRVAVADAVARAAEPDVVEAPPFHCSASTFARSSLRCTALMTVWPVFSVGSV